ncbi:MAG: hypothetical protein ACJA2W_003052, partial [Planctomycetota bacterium]
MFAHPLGLLGLASLAAILGLHLYRRRRTPLVVSAVFLWEDVTSEAQGGRTRQPLRRSLSLLAELLGALCLTLALAGPRWFGESAASHYVAVIDTSASLTARSGIDGTTARERARDVMAEKLRQLGSSDRATLILTGPEPSILAGPFAFRDEALARLADPWPTFGDHAATSALLLATEFASGGSIDHLTDRAPDQLGLSKTETSGGPAERIRRIAVGEPARNVGFTAARRTRTAAGDDEVRLVVRNSGDQAAEFTIDLKAARDTGSAPEAPATPSADAAPLTLKPSSTRTLTYRLPADAPPIVARLMPTGDGALDGFPLDDEAFLCPPPKRTLRLASLLPEGPARTLGLSSAERWASIVVDAESVDADDDPHLVIAIGPAPPARKPAGNPPGTPAAWSLLLQGQAPEPSHLVGPFLLDATSGVLEGVSLDGVVWSMDEAAPVDPQANVLAYAGETPLITETRRPDGARTWRLRIDPERSNLGRSADWPILLANVAEERRIALPGPERTSLAAGDRFLWRGAPAQELELVAPDGSTRTIPPSPSGDLITPRLDQVGLWELHPSGGGESNVLQRVGVSLLSPAESDLTDRATYRPATQDEFSLGETAL